MELPTTDRKKQLLIFLGIIFAISLVYRLLHPFRQQTVEELTYTGERPAAVEVEKVISYQEAMGFSDVKRNVMIDLFFNAPHHSANVMKDIFSDKSSGLTRTTSNIAAVSKDTAGKVAMSQKKTPLAQMYQDLSQLKVFGIYEDGSEKVLFLENEKGVTLVRKGDRIDGKYHVKNITDLSLIIRSEKLHMNVSYDISDFK